jgi:hypothetical protein
MRDGTALRDLTDPDVIKQLDHPGCNEYNGKFPFIMAENKHQVEGVDQEGNAYI